MSDSTPIKNRLIPAGLETSLGVNTEVNPNHHTKYTIPRSEDKNELNDSSCGDSDSVGLMVEHALSTRDAGPTEWIIHLTCVLISGSLLILFP